MTTERDEIAYDVVYTHTFTVACRVTLTAAQDLASASTAAAILVAVENNEVEEADPGDSSDFQLLSWKERA